MKHAPHSAAPRPGSVKQTLIELGITPKKSRGQNFLLNPAAAAEIVRFAGLSRDENVLEIGPGLGILTRELLTHACSVHAVEIEEQLCRYLHQSLPLSSAQQILCADIREVTVEDVVGGTAPITVFGNVPYSISTEVIFWILRQRTTIGRAILLLQREFAERVAAHPGNKRFGSLTVHVALHCETRLGPIMSGQSFFPAAEVESRLVELQILPEPRCVVQNEAVLEDVVRGLFSTRRKTLLNCLLFSKLVANRSDGERVLAELGVSPERRPETLDPTDFARLANLLADRAESSGPFA